MLISNTRDTCTAHKHRVFISAFQIVKEHQTSAHSANSWFKKPNVIHLTRYIKFGLFFNEEEVNST